jgi:hypothetical protein
MGAKTARVADEQQAIPEAVSEKSDGQL